jgi:hypothetical protein
MPASLAILGLIACALLWVIWSERRTRSRDNGGWLDEGEAMTDLYPSHGRQVVGTVRDWDWPA